jgi:hypothetical protein
VFKPSTAKKKKETEYTYFANKLVLLRPSLTEMGVRIFVSIETSSTPS